MKKMMIAMTLAAAALCSVSGNNSPVNEMQDSTVEVKSLSYVGSVPAQTEAWTPIVPPMNALVMAMLEKDLDCRTSDPEFFWNSMYYMIGIYGDMDWRAEDLAGHYIVPEEMVYDCAYALFGLETGLPELPESLENFVTHDADNFNYIMAKGDVGLAETVVTEVTALGDGRHAVEGAFVALVDEALICEFVAVLEESDSLYGYHVEDISILP